MWLENYGKLACELHNRSSSNVKDKLLNTFRAELHVHTVLSPCAQIEMIPPLIVREALNSGIEILAITDHNASENIISIQKAAQNQNLIILPGMELQTKEEVHVLCLFDTLEQIREFQQFVDANMPDIPNKPDFFGEQFVVDETGDFIRNEEKLLLASADISLTQAYNKVEQLEGLFIPAHINRKAFGLIEVLGIVPTDIHIEAVEISRHITPEQATTRFPQIAGIPLIQNGDVHGIEEFLGANLITIEQPSIKELKWALQGMNGRSWKIALRHELS